MESSKLSDLTQTRLEDKENMTTNHESKTNHKRGSFSSWRGNSYPEVKLRGFYSDITSHQNLEKTRVY